MRVQGTGRQGKQGRAGHGTAAATRHLTLANQREREKHAEDIDMFYFLYDNWLNA